MWFVPLELQLEMVVYFHSGSELPSLAFPVSQRTVAMAPPIRGLVTHMAVARRKTYLRSVSLLIHNTSNTYIAIPQVYPGSLSPSMALREKYRKEKPPPSTTMRSKSVTGFLASS